MSKMQLFWVMEGAGILGMLMHFLKLKIKGQTPSDILAYFKNNFRDTLVALGATTFGILGAWATMDPLNWIGAIVAAISVGFAFDSMFNSSERS